MDHKTYPANVTLVVDDALQPLISLKEIRYGLEGHEVADPSHYACVIASLVADAHRKLVAMQAPLEAEFGRIFFLRATASNPNAETDEIVGVEVEPASTKGSLHVAEAQA